MYIMASIKFFKKRCSCLWGVSKQVKKNTKAHNLLAFWVTLDVAGGEKYPNY